MRQRSLDEMITYFNQEIDKMDIDRRYKIALLGMVTAIGCTAKQTIEVRKKGKWVYHDDDDMRFDTYHCSSCRKLFTVDAERFDDIGFVKEDLKYCPNCGADMRGGDE